MRAVLRFVAELIVSGVGNVTPGTQYLVSGQGDHNPDEDQERARDDVDPAQRLGRFQQGPRAVHEGGEHEVAQKRHGEGHRDDRGDVGAGHPGQVEEARQDAHVEQDRLRVAEDDGEPGKKARPHPGARQAAVGADRSVGVPDQKHPHHDEDEGRHPLQDRHDPGETRCDPGHAEDGKKRPEQIADHDAKRQRPGCVEAPRHRPRGQRHPDRSRGQEQDEDGPGIEGKVGQRDRHGGERSRIADRGKGPSGTTPAPRRPCSAARGYRTPRSVGSPGRRRPSPALRSTRRRRAGCRPHPPPVRSVQGRR